MTHLFPSLTVNQSKRFIGHCRGVLSNLMHRSVSLHEAQETGARLLGFAHHHELQHHLKTGRTAMETALVATALLRTTLLNQSLIFWEGPEEDFDRGLFAQPHRLADLFRAVSVFHAQSPEVRVEVQDGGLILLLDPSVPPEVWCALTMAHLGSALASEGLGMNPTNHSLFPTVLVFAPSEVPTFKKTSRPGP